MRKVGPIQCQEVVQDPEAPWVVMFHGFGADSSDLKPLGDLIPTTKACNYLFPHGVLEVPIGPGWTGRAWWPIDMNRLQKQAEQGDEWDISTESPPSLPSVRQKIFQMIEAMRVPWNKIILSGFSQGGMLATDLALHAPENPLGLALMSTALINKADWKSVAGQRKGLPFFQSHGDKDAVLTLRNGQRLETFLNSAGLKGGLFKFSGGHEIPPLMIERLGKYLSDRLSIEG